jgi:hypothetical protein
VGRGERRGIVTRRAGCKWLMRKGVRGITQEIKHLVGRLDLGIAAVKQRVRVSPRGVMGAGFGEGKPACQAVRRSRRDGRLRLRGTGARRPVVTEVAVGRSAMLKARHGGHVSLGAVLIKADRGRIEDPSPPQRVGTHSREGGRVLFAARQACKVYWRSNPCSARGRGKAG